MEGITTPISNKGSNVDSVLSHLKVLALLKQIMNESRWVGTYGGFYYMILGYAKNLVNNEIPPISKIQPLILGGFCLPKIHFVVYILVRRKISSFDNLLKY